MSSQTIWALIGILGLIWFFYTLLRVHRHKGDAVPVSNLLHFVFSSDMVVISIIMILMRITA